MDVFFVKSAIRPLALVSYKLLGAPVPYSGRDVEITVRNRIDDSGTMHWVRNFIKNVTFPHAVTFTSHMVRSGDHRVIEYTRRGIGVESDLSVDADGSLAYEIRRYVVSVPFLGLIVRLPTWLTPFGGGRTTETGVDEDSFRVKFEMAHPIFGRTLGYTGRCRFESSG